MPNETLKLISTLEFEKECWYRRIQENSDEWVKHGLWIEFDRVEKMINQAVDRFSRESKIG